MEKDFNTSEEVEISDGANVLLLIYSFMKSYFDPFITRTLT